MPCPDCNVDDPPELPPGVQGHGALLVPTLTQWLITLVARNRARRRRAAGARHADTILPPECSLWTWPKKAGKVPKTAQSFIALAAPWAGFGEGVPGGAVSSRSPNRAPGRPRGDCAGFARSRVVMMGLRQPGGEGGPAGRDRPGKERPRLPGKGAGPLEATIEPGGQGWTPGS